MPRNTKSSKSENVEVTEPVVENTETEVKKSKSEKSRKREKEEKTVTEAPSTPTPAPEPVTEQPAKKQRKSKAKSQETPEGRPEGASEGRPEGASEEKSVEKQEESVEEGDTKRKRRQVSRESLDADFTAVLETLNNLVTEVADKKPVSLRSLKRLQKSVSTLHQDSLKVCKLKQHNKRSENTESGFMKPVKISKDLCKFTGWNPEELRSRVEVTKYICDYIRQKNLQNPADRRQFTPDPQLSKLLGHDSSKDGNLTYPGLQQKLQTHFTRVSQ